MNLHDYYQNLVIKSSGSLLVIAGPGAGKTTTIIGKINYLLSSGINKNEILLLSFTNTSVIDLKNKINADVFVTTFHKLAIDILKFNNITFNVTNNNLLDYIIDEFFYSLSYKEKKRLLRYLNIRRFSVNSHEFIYIKNLIKTFITLFKTNNYNKNNLINIVTNYKDKYLIKIILVIFDNYEKEKQSTNTFDYDDLIIKATDILITTKNYKKFKYIIVDEFQDTSFIRLNLIKKIYELNSAKIIAVGDDFQSIYHFSGCSPEIFLNFKKHFPESKIHYLKYTYRNSQELINIATNFINKNSFQLKKEMISLKRRESPIEIISYFNPVKKLKKLLNSINGEILILYRNKKDLFIYVDKDILIKNDYLIYDNRKYKHLTIHSAKGLEAENVIILNCSNELMGIPNKIVSHPILNYVIKNEDNYPFAEERRVFFVALTRCKEKVYLLTPFNNPSPFIKEIKELFFIN